MKVDGELDEASAATLLAHLEACERCRAFAANLDAVCERVEAEPVSDLRWGLTERVMARIADVEPGAPRGATLGWRPALRPAPIGVGAVSFCAGAVLVILANGQSSTGQTAEASPPRGDLVAAIGGDLFGVESPARLEEAIVDVLPEPEG